VPAGRTAPRCSIIIPVFNHASLTRQCLNRLFAQRTEVETEIIVVDDASRDLTPRLLSSYGDRIRVVRHTVNTGFAITCNDGAMVASGDYLVFLNNDTLPEPGWLDALVRYAEAHPRVAVVGSKMVFLDNTVQHAGVVIAQNGFPNLLYAGFPADHPAVNKTRAFRSVMGASMLVRRAAFEEVGGFDIGYFNCYEDVDLCLRLGERATRSTTVTRASSTTSDRSPGTRLRFESINSRT
jgi:GT2 family glycosyltransferase